MPYSQSLQVHYTHKAPGDCIARKAWREPERLAHTLSKLATALPTIMRVTIHFAKEQCAFAQEKEAMGEGQRARVGLVRLSY